MPHERIVGQTVNIVEEETSVVEAIKVLKIKNALTKGETSVVEAAKVAETKIHEILPNDHLLLKTKVGLVSLNIILLITLLQPLPKGNYSCADFQQRKVLRH
jgi:hypothetical protein